MKLDLAVIRDKLLEFNHSHKCNNSSLTMNSIFLNVCLHRIKLCHQRISQVYWRKDACRYDRLRKEAD